MTNQQTELSHEALAAALKRDEALREEVRAELRAEPFRLFCMYSSDFLSVLFRTAFETLIVIAAFLVWPVLSVPGKVTFQAFQSGTIDSISMLAFTVTLLTFFFVVVLRGGCGALSKTHDSVFSTMYETRRARARTVDLIEAVLKRHELV